MDRRKFLKLGTSTLAFGALGLSKPANALLACSYPNQFGVQQCRAGIDSYLSYVTAAAVNGQHMNQWCWAACIEMVFRFYGLQVPQEQIVYQTWGQIVNLPGQPDQILSNLNRSWIDSSGRRFRVEGNSYTANPVTASQDLASDMPLIIGTQGHAMMLTQVEYLRDAWGRGQVLSAIVQDPWPGRGQRVLTPQEWYNTSFLARIRVYRS